MARRGLPTAGPALLLPLGWTSVGGSMGWLHNELHNELHNLFCIWLHCYTMLSLSPTSCLQSSSRTTALSGPSWMAKCWTPAGSMPCSMTARPVERERVGAE